MSEAVLHEEETYVSLHQNTVAQLIATRPIMDLCLEVERRPESRVSKQRWDQEGLELEGIWTAAWEEECEGVGRRWTGWIRRQIKSVGR